MDLGEFVLLSMRQGLKRTLSEMMGPEESKRFRERNSKKVKYLHIDKSPDRYVRPLVSRFRDLQILIEREKMRLRSERLTGGDKYAAKIQRFWCGAQGLRKVVNNTEDEGHEGNVRFEGKDVICPITQEAIPWRMVFKFVTNDGAVIAYTTPHLVSYLLSSGKFQCCLTRGKFNNVVIGRLYRKAVRLGVDGAERLMMVYDQRRQILARQIERDNAILAIESSCGTAMSEAMDVCANLNIPTHQATTMLQAEILPEWRQMVDDYIRLDTESCRGMLVADREKLFRLGMSVDSDPHGLLEIIAESVNERISRCDSYNRSMSAPASLRFRPFPRDSFTQFLMRQTAIPRPVSLDHDLDRVFRAAFGPSFNSELVFGLEQPPSESTESSGDDTDSPS
jgi:hypothetical protein